MIRDLAARYLSALDIEMRRVVATAPEAPEFDILIKYPLGWVDKFGHPYNGTTGKRIRPILLLLACEAAGGKWGTALPAAAAVELLHNFSLIHDDIQDDSDTRHNRPTVWRIWGRANAINAGDATFALAYTALEGLSKQSLHAETIFEVWRIFNQTNLLLTRGQHLDMRFERQAVVTPDEYIGMITGKSAALIAACAHMGALIGSQDKAMAAHFAAFGLNLGIAFQIRDDILGIWGDEQVTGKSAATDVLSRKKSLPVLYALEQSEALRHLYGREPFGADEVTEALRLIDDLDALAYTQQMETAYYERALAALEDSGAEGDAADGLHQLAVSLFQREA